MSVDFTKPVATGDRAQNLVDTKDTLVAVAKQRPDLAAGGIAADMIRWSSGGNKWEIFNGSAWADLASTYAINVSSFNGQAASYYTNIVARLGFTPVNKAGDTMTGPLVLNADPSATLGAATKGYVDTGLSGKADAAHTHEWSAITSRLSVEGALTQDPNAAAYPCVMTNHANTPDTGSYWYITTVDAGSGSKSQIAAEHAGSHRVYMRNQASSVWSSWYRCDLGEGLTRSIGTNGYAKLPGLGGLMLQWGTFTRTAGVQSVSFPATFPIACFVVVQNDNYAASINDSSRAYNITTSGFTSGRADASSFPVNYIAVGY